MPIQYRVAGIEDVEELVRLRCRFLSEANGRAVEEELGCAIRQMLLKRMPNGTVVSWLAADGGQAVGTGCIVFWERMPNLSSPDGVCGYIQNMYTVPEWRGRGIASTIFGHLLNEARSRNVGSVSLHALPAGAGIYRKAGFGFSADAMGMRL